MDAGKSHPWARPAGAVLAGLGTDPRKGLSGAEAAVRLRCHGPNTVTRTRRRSIGRVLLDQFASLITLLLFIAAAVALAMGDIPEAVAITVVIALNTAIGFFTELQALRSMDALRELGQVPATVRRDGKLLRVDARELVPGDILVQEGGDVVSADARLLQSSRLQADESLLTGESEPVDKDAAPLPLDTPPPERHNMVFKGSALTRGHAEAVVAATGADTQVGHIASLTAGTEADITPLEKTLKRLGHRLVAVTAVVCVLVAAVSLYTGRDVLLSIETAIALAVAAIPEGLPIVATIALARGMWRMARANALIERLAAVETLGATSIILSDKTGTLTANRMTVRRLLTADGDCQLDGSAPEASFNRMLMTGILCSTAELGPGEQDRGIGDPTEIALLAAGRQAGLDADELRERFPCIQQLAFDSQVKMMATVHLGGRGLVYCVKGAPEVVLEACSAEWTADSARPLDPARRTRWLTRANELGESGLRTLALAFKEEDRADLHPYHDLTLLGITGIADPPHPGIAEDMAACHAAGIRVVMVTGDQLGTARAIANEIGLCPPDHSCHYLDARELDSTEGHARQLEAADVIARASPRLKLELIALHQARGRVVAMTGDGVNDAPALKKADIGVAMGLRGTQVAREAAVMVLEDDEFSTILRAVAQGRVIYANIRKFVMYLLSCNLSEILVIGLATLVGAAPPLLPLQILFLNLVTDVFPALALGLCGPGRDVMTRPPRPPDQPLITPGHWRRIAAHALLLTIAVLGGVELVAYLPALAGEDPLTLAFLTLALAQLWHVFNVRADRSGLLQNEITRNPWVWGAIILCLLVVGAALALPTLRQVLDLSLPGPAGWMLIVTTSLLPLLAAPLLARLMPTDANEH